MVPDAIHGHILYEALYAVGVFIASYITGRVVSKVVFPLIRKLTAKSRTNIDDLLLHAFSTPIILFITVQGTFSALQGLSALDQAEDELNKAWLATSVAIAFWLLSRLLQAAITWYGQEVASKTETKWDDQALPIIKRIVSITTLTIGVLFVLQSIGISISPLLAALGIGGLAVALALQPTLSNFISGTYVLSDGSLRPGDYIEVSGGPVGTVQEVGWRITKLLTPQNNIVVIPNAKLADSVITNYNQPLPAINVPTECGVSYESDLARVEQTALEVMLAIRDRMPEADKSFEPRVIFSSFGDSNITFNCVMRATDRPGSFRMKSALIRDLHKRFTAEGIEINYPVRKLMFPQNGTPAPAPRLFTEPPPPPEPGGDDEPKGTYRGRPIKGKVGTYGNRADEDDDGGD
ncbi:MAG: mechanosensitive ion channel family protein [Chloroflexi bacterium]|nr:mechanosensitive ion channel family protein [Chloroflexota bacterium]